MVNSEIILGEDVRIEKKVLLVASLETGWGGKETGEAFICLFVGSFIHSFRKNVLTSAVRQNV